LDRKINGFKRNLTLLEQQCTFMDLVSRFFMRHPKDRTAFNDLVYEIVKAIPHGKVMTYGGIAALIPHPIGMDPLAYVRVRARWVGYAMRSCGEDVPWHRVINAKGQVSIRHGHGPHIQRNYMEEEGVTFDANDRVNLKDYRWHPPTEWLLARGLLPPTEDPSNSSQPRLL
jgi:methylated-DNA-protein-cysteine methyltransferase-like protein